MTDRRDAHSRAADLEGTPPGQQLLAEAQRHHQAGRLAEAEMLYRRVLAAEPAHFRALHYLGVAAAQRGEYGQAEILIRRALALAPNYLEAHNNLGLALQSLGRLDDAVVSFRRALALKPDYVETHFNLGVAQQSQGQFPEAIASYRRAVALKPDYAEAYNNLGNALLSQGFRQEALDSLRQALALKPLKPEAHNNLGLALQACGLLDDAVNSYQRAIELKADYAEAYSNLGNALLAQGHADAAFASYQDAIALKPDTAEFHYNLGEARRLRGLLEEAVASYRQAIALKPDYVDAYNNLGNAYLALRCHEDAAVSYRRALELQPGMSFAHSNLLMSRQYDQAMSPGSLLLEHRAYGERAQRAPVPAHANARNPAKRLKIGYVSADFRRHPIGYFLSPVLANHDRRNFAIYCYYGDAREDAITASLRSHAEVWRSSVGVTDDELVEIIRADGIDILIDLSGHTSKNRLPVFARKPAPVQATWAGYVGTTGLSRIDYLITDRWESPPGSERYAVEKLLRLPDGYVCYSPPADAPGVGPLPAVRQKAVTFGCFNNLAKINPRVIALWGALLRALPSARLVLKTRALGEATARRQILALFAAEDISPQRIELEGHSPHRQLLMRYNDIDVALDPFPYSGGLTTIEALWMGVPVVTLGGETFASRHSLSHLNAVGLGELVAVDAADYLRVAQELASDLARLGALRAGLRDRLKNSTLLNGERFTRALEAAFRDIWKTWCHSGGSDQA
jgi:predicted O-linked N-acetylglucosamine transferase (SPINDLY family)